MLRTGLASAHPVGIEIGIDTAKFDVALRHARERLTTMGAKAPQPAPNRDDPAYRKPEPSPPPPPPSGLSMEYFSYGPSSAEVREAQRRIAARKGLLPLPPTAEEFEARRRREAADRAIVATADACRGQAEPTLSQASVPGRIFAAFLLGASCGFGLGLGLMALAWILRG